MFSFTSYLSKGSSSWSISSKSFRMWRMYCFPPRRSRKFAIIFVSSIRFSSSSSSMRFIMNWNNSFRVFSFPMEEEIVGRFLIARRRVRESELRRSSMLIMGWVNKLVIDKLNIKIIIIMCDILFLLFYISH